jgi:hypothetical protein
MSTESIEYDFPGDKVTGVATGAAVTGSRLVALQDNVAASGELTGIRPIAHSTAKDQAHYLARTDAAQNATVSLVRKGTFSVTAGAAITAPAALMVATGGKVVTATDDCYVVGYALTDAAADGDPVVVELNLPGFFLNAVTA